MSSFHHYTLEERESLHIGLISGKSMRQIAKEIKRIPSSIAVLFILFVFIFNMKQSKYKTTY